MQNRVHYGWIVIFMGLIATVTAHGFGRMAYTLLLPAMKDGLGFDYTHLGLLGTANFIGYLSMAIIGGFLAARFGTRIVLTLALFFMGVTMILTGLAQSFGYAFLMRLLTGIGNGAAFVPAMALGSAWFAVTRRGFATGIVSGGIGLGTLLSGLIVPRILAIYGSEGWRYSWYILGFSVLLASILIYFFVRNQPEDKGLLPVGETESKPKVNFEEDKKKPVGTWRTVCQMKSLWYLGLVYFFYGLSYIIYIVFFAAYLVKEIGYSDAWAGGLWAAVGGMSVFCGIIWGGISDRFGRGKGAAVAYFVLGLSYIIFALIKTKIGFYSSAVLFGFTAWSIPTIMAATAGDLVGPKLAPAGLGFVTLFFGIGQSIGPALGGLLADVSGSFVLPFLIAGGVSFLGMIFSLFLKPVEKG